CNPRSPCGLAVGGSGSTSRLRRDVLRMRAPRSWNMGVSGTQAVLCGLWDYGEKEQKIEEGLQDQSCRLKPAVRCRHREAWRGGRQALVGVRDQAQQCARLPEGRVHLEKPGTDRRILEAFRRDQ